MEQATLLRTLVVIQTGGKVMIIKTFIVCLISFLLGYFTTPYNPEETNKEERMFQLFALTVSIATVITLALM